MDGYSPAKNCFDMLFEQWTTFDVSTELTSTRTSFNLHAYNVSTGDSPNNSNFPLGVFCS